jgi:hypothetical protein
MDNLIVQAYYNPSLLAVLKKLILGEDQSTYKKLPLSKYKDIVSSNLYLIDMPHDDHKIFGMSGGEYNSTRVYQENDIFLKRITFREVFNGLLKQKILVIGVYRYFEKNNYERSNVFSNFSKIPNSSNFFYVDTSPDKDFELNPKDKLFVFSQTFPDENNFYSTIKKDNKLHLKENMVSVNETIQFSKYHNKKTEEKKDNLKLFDDIGETKIKEVNNLFKDTIDHLKSLKSNMGGIKDKIDKVIPELIRKKISQLNNTNNLSVSSDGSITSNSESGVDQDNKEVDREET